MDKQQRHQDINRHLAEIALEYHAEYLDVHSLLSMQEARRLSPGRRRAFERQGYEVWANKVERFLKK
jgi:beta-galactosidase beta subunit